MARKKKKDDEPDEQYYEGLAAEYKANREPEKSAAALRIMEAIRTARLQAEHQQALADAEELLREDG